MDFVNFFLLRYFVDRHMLVTSMMLFFFCLVHQCVFFFIRGMENHSGTCKACLEQMAGVVM